jgi:hypothetical protein
MCIVIMTLILLNAWSGQLACYDYQAVTDKVLVIYGADRAEGEEESDPGQDSRKIVEYHVRSRMPFWGGAFLLSTFYVDWSTSLIGDLLCITTS